MWRITNINLSRTAHLRFRVPRDSKALRIATRQHNHIGILYARNLRWELGIDSGTSLETIKLLKAKGANMAFVVKKAIDEDDNKLLKKLKKWDKEFVDTVEALYLGNKSHGTYNMEYCSWLYD